MTPARSSSSFHHCASPKGEDQHFKLLFLFTVSKPCCREDFSLQTEDRRQTRNHSTFALGNQVKQSSRWCHLSQNRVRTIQPDPGRQYILLFEEDLCDCRQVLSAQPRWTSCQHQVAPVTQSQTEGTKLLIQRIISRYCNIAIFLCSQS